MITFIKDKKVLIASGIALIVIVVFFMLVYLPERNKVNELKNRLKVMDDQIKLTEAMLGDLNRLAPILADMQKELVSFEGRLPDRRKISLVISELFNLAKSSSVKVVSIKPQEPITLTDDNKQPITLGKTRLKSMKVTLELQGSYREIAEYVKKIQDSLNILATIDDVTIRKDDNIVPDLPADLVLTVYIADKV